jgi:CO/xanthine dehydrogenase FAD-binding subunit
VGPRAFVVSDGTGVLADPQAAAADKEAILRQLLTRASPISDVRASQDYRAAMLRVLSLRTLRVCGDRLDATR